MAVYSIRDLEELTGVKAHTIRIWEKRYGIMTPKRTPTNIRYYEDADLKHLLNIAMLNRNGFKISKIAKMSEADISEHVAQLTDIQVEDQDKVDALTLSLIDLDSFKFQSILNSNIDQLGFEKTMIEVIYPFLEKLGLLWMSGSINQVHEKFLNFLVKQKILGAIDRIEQRPLKDNAKFLIFLPPHSDQELSLLFSHYLLQNRGFRVINLGYDTSTEDILIAVELSNPDFLFMINLDNHHDEVVQLMGTLVKKTETRILITGNPLENTPSLPAERVISLGGMDGTLKFLGDLNPVEA